MSTKVVIEDICTKVRNGNTKAEVKTEEVEGIGHWHAVEEPERVAKALMDWFV